MSIRRARPEASGKATRLSGACRPRALCLATAVTLLCGFGSSASATEAGPGQDRAAPSYPVDVRAVALDVLVTDRDGRFVSGLEAGDFRVLEEGVGQELTLFNAGRTPVTVVVLLDSSASVRSDMLSIQKAANRFIRRLESGDRARIGFFHEQVVFGPRFTDDMKEHSAMIKQMQPQRSTHLYDALVEAFEKLASVPDRKALVVFSDGDDQGSGISMEDTLEAARRSDVSVYSVGLRGWSAAGGMHTNERLLEQVARLTGGGAFFPGKDKEMQKAFDRIGAELHHSYRMGYVPAAHAAGPGQWREIRVELTRRKDLVVRCRRGYYADRQEAP